MKELTGLREEIFEEGKLYAWLKSYCEEHTLPQAQRALIYARKMHKGQTRKMDRFCSEQVPYIVHPMTLAKEAIALGLSDDVTVSCALLHDVCEDCGVDVSLLPFDDDIRRIVGMLTRPTEPGLTVQERNILYYKGMENNPTAILIKGLDRAHNVSTMAYSFNEERIVEYIEETEEFVLPLLDSIDSGFPQFSPAAFAIRYHILSVTETVKFCMEGMWL